MKLTILGPAGRTGRLLLEQALQAGHEPTVLVRDPAKLAGADGVRVIQGDARDGTALGQAVQGAEVVLSALGPHSNREGGLLAAAVPAALEAMRKTGARRYLAVSGAGATVPGERKALVDRVAAAAMKVVARPIVEDKEAEIAALQGSAIEWVLVRPPRLTEGPVSGRYRVGLDVALGPRAVISRADVAHFLLSQLEDATWVGKAPFIRAV